MKTPFWKTPLRLALAASLILGLAAPAGSQTPAPLPVGPMTPDIPKAFYEPTDRNDYVRREVMIPMRDGTKLFTVIVIPKGAWEAPILLTRTPYNAARRTERSPSPHMLAILPQSDELFVRAGYIRVFQDVRGKYGSEGEYVMTRPPRGPLNPTGIDHATDAWDTIEWLVKHVPESNRKVGMIGSSYEGFTVVAALLDPHPALKVAAPESPMIDGWMGDDWFHYGAFRQTGLDFFASHTSAKSGGDNITRSGWDDYETFRRAGSAGAFAETAGLDQLPWWRKILAHPAYDAFWQEQALDRLLAARPLKVPTMWVGALYDQEDGWGAVHAYAALEAKDTGNDRNFLVLGPWRHSGFNYEGYGLGPLRFEGDTALQFRRDVLLPFFNQYLKDGAAKAQTPPVFVYETGTNVWRRYPEWPRACAVGCPGPAQGLYLREDGGLSWGPPRHDAGYDEYVSDPAKPVPYLPRPIRFADGDAWKRWLVGDQRFVSDRPDVLTYMTEPLTQPLRISGAPVATLYASTSGTDADWVVKLIDVYPDEVPSQPEMGGYQLPVSMDIFRGRYRESFEHPAAVPAGEVLRYRFVMPTANHVFLPGHRVMVQVQSTWFPLYDRNPQTFVPSIFAAQPADYRKATQRIYRQGETASAISLPVWQPN